jgi:enterochelin esterase family protein
MSNQELLISPRISKLEQGIEGGDHQILKNFWEELEEEKTPMVEAIPGDNEYSLVTFLWRADEIKQVSMISLLTNPTTHPMTRLLDTDLWYLTCKVRNDVRATYQFIEEALAPSDEADNDPYSRFARYKPDPLNPLTFDFFTEVEDPMGVKFTRTVLEMPAAPPQPWSRRTWVYTPAGYSQESDQKYSLLILFDGWGYANLTPTFTILDNLITAELIPPVVAVMPDSLEAEVRMRELIFHSPFNQFLVTELLPWVHQRYQVTSDPGHVVVGGSSAGGLAAAFAAFEHPEVFGNVLAQSGAFAFSFPGEEEPEWLARQFAEREKLSINFYIDAGILEVNSLRDIGDGPNLLTATRNFCGVLDEKGYQVTLNELPGGHDYISWEGSLPIGLQTLVGRLKEGS